MAGIRDTWILNLRVGLGARAALSRPFNWRTRFGPYQWHACASGQSCVMGQTRVLPVAVRGCGAWEEARVWTRPGDWEVT